MVDEAILKAHLWGWMHEAGGDIRPSGAAKVRQLLPKYVRRRRSAAEQNPGSATEPEAGHPVSLWTALMSHARIGQRDYIR